MYHPASAGDRAFAGLQQLLPQSWLSNMMHSAARSTRPGLRRTLIREVLRAYPQIDMTEALQPDPYAYASFNDFFTRALRPGVRPVEGDAHTLVSPVDGTVSQFGSIDAGRLVQAKGMEYGVGELLADSAAAVQYLGGRYACLYLAPYNYHRIHLPIEARLAAARYVPGALFSVNAATARAVPRLFARNERVVCEFSTALGPMALVLVGALFVGSIETVWHGEVNPPPLRGGAAAQDLLAGIGDARARAEEVARFNMGSTVILLLGNSAARFARGICCETPIRLGQALLQAEPTA